MSRFLVAALLLCGAPAAAECVPEFPYTRWLGADAAYSVPLPDGRSFWLFGDTFVAARGATTRKGAALVANTVALSSCEKGAFRIGYSWRGSSAAAAPYFQPREPDVKYWPLDGFVHAGKLYVALSRIRTVKTGLGFANAGTDLAAVAIGTGTPTSWKVEVAALSKDTSAYVGSSIVVENGYAFLFTAVEGGAHPAVLARLPLRFVDSPEGNLEYLTKDGSWNPGLKLADARVVIDGAATEMSVRHHDEADVWVAVHASGGFPSPGISLRTAKELAGPWSPAAVLTAYPEAKAPKKLGLFCYAAKEHPEFGKRGELVATYACNTMKLETLLSRPDLYRPQVLRFTKLPLPRGEGVSRGKVAAEKKTAGKKPAVDKARRGRDSNP